jgi:hypothetical protein
MQRNVAIAAPNAMQAQHDRDSCRVHQPPTGSRRPAALSSAAQRCCHREPCTLNTSVTHFKCISLTPEARAPLPSALQPNAAVAAPSAMHAPHERDSHQACEPHTRSRCPAALRTAANAAVAAPGALHAQQEHTLLRAHQPHARSRCPAALSIAAQCCYCRVPCTPRA